MSDVSRRQFLQMVGASAAGAVVFGGCQAPHPELTIQSRVRLAEDLVSAYDDWYATACRGCGAGCGAIVRVVGGRATKLEGNPAHPLNVGRSCARAQAMVQEQYHPDRITGPLGRSGGRDGAPDPITWDAGLDRLAARLRELQAAGRGGEAALITRAEGGHRGLLLGRFAEALGASWLRLEPLPQAAAREAARRVFGGTALPSFDIRNARSILSFGADFLGTWVSPVHYAVQYGEFRQGSYEVGRFAPRFEAGAPRGYFVQVEPRFSTTAASADEWVWVRPGREGLLALSLAQVVLAEGLADPTGAAAFGDPRALDGYAPERVAAETGVEAGRIRRLAREFVERQPGIALGGGPAAGQTNGTDSLTAIYALNVLVGNVGRPGGVLPGASIEGLPTVTPSGLAEWQALADRLRGGQVSAVLVYGANPLHGLPAALGFDEALGRAPFIASFSSFADETTALADLVLPSHLPLEAWSDAAPDPAPGGAVLTLQQPVVQPLHDTRSVWDVLLTVAAEVGGPLAGALPWSTFEDLLHDGVRGLEARSRGAAPEVDFERAWVEVLRRGVWERGSSSRTQLALGSGGAGVSGSGGGSPVVPGWAAPQFAGEEGEYPLHLVVFPNQAIGEGEGAHLPWLQAAPDPITTVAWQSWVEVSPRLAERLGVKEGDVVGVETPRGRVEAPVYVNPAASPEVVAMPAGQGHAGYGRWADGRGVNPLAILEPLTDGATGALAYGATRARLVKMGRSAPLPKFEGTAPARQLDEEKVLKVTSGQ